MEDNLLRYSLKTEECGHRHIHLIPTLDEVITDSNIGTYYNRSNFSDFLSNMHCLENLEFILEVGNYLELLTEYDRKCYWKIIYKNFIEEESPKEINLQYSIKKNLSEQELPSVRCLLSARLVIYEILLDSYNEFIKHIRLTTNDISRRKSEITAPETPSYGKVNIPRSASIDSPPDVGICKLADFAQTSYDIEQPLTPTKSQKDSTSSSRGSSIGSIVENLKHNDYMNFKKTVKKFRIRRSSNEI